METITEYDRGYRDGIVAASDAVAAFYAGIKTKDDKALAQLADAHAMMHRLLLDMLAPLQDQVRRLRPEPVRADG